MVYQAPPLLRAVSTRVLLWLICLITGIELALAQLDFALINVSLETLCRAQYIVDRDRAKLNDVSLFWPFVLSFESCIQFLCVQCLAKQPLSPSRPHSAISQLA